jgi:hypothetical protein
MAEPHVLTEGHVARYRRQEEWLHEAWRRSLEGQGVAWPEKAPVKRAQLVGLSFFVGEAVSKDSLGRFVQEIAGGALDTQVRHLRASGWNVIGGGRGEAHHNHLPNGERMPRNAYALASVTTPATRFVQSLRLKRQGRVGVRDWDDLCRLYDGRCAHCGVSVRKPDKGHMDPERGQDISNLIPLCVECNNWAQDDVMFDEEGRVKAVLSERFLKDAPEQALDRIRAWLARR